MTYQTVFNVQTEELPFVTVKELFEDEIEFKVDNIHIKRDVVGKYGVSDVAYVTIMIGDSKMLVSVKNEVLFKSFEWIKNARDADKDPYGPDADYRINMPEGKSYYVLQVDVEE